MSASPPHPYAWVITGHAGEVVGEFSLRAIEGRVFIERRRRKVASRADKLPEAGDSIRAAQRDTAISPISRHGSGGESGERMLADSEYRPVNFILCPVNRPMLPPPPQVACLLIGNDAAADAVSPAEMMRFACAIRPSGRGRSEALAIR